MHDIRHREYAGIECKLEGFYLLSAQKAALKHDPSSRILLQPVEEPHYSVQDSPFHFVSARVWTEAEEALEC